MECKFRVGDTIQCVDSSDLPPWGATRDEWTITKGKKYKVLAIHPSDEDEGYIIKIINDVGREKGYYEWRFKKVDIKPIEPYGIVKFLAEVEKR